MSGAAAGDFASSRGQAPHGDAPLTLAERDLRAPFSLWARRENQPAEEPDPGEWATGLTFRLAD